jgi:hypothetical protein
MNAVARVEWVTETIGKLRVWNSEEKTFGDPYYLGAMVVMVGYRAVEISLVDKKIRKNHWTAIIRFCRREGIQTIVAKRFRRGVECEHFIEVR